MTFGRKMVQLIHDNLIDIAAVDLRSQTEKETVRLIVKSGE